VSKVFGVSAGCVAALSLIGIGLPLAAGASGTGGVDWVVVAGVAFAAGVVDVEVPPMLLGGVAATRFSPVVPSAERDALEPDDSRGDSPPHPTSALPKQNDRIPIDSRSSTRMVGVSSNDPRLDTKSDFGGAEESPRFSLLFFVFS
jgi:hypothetical protein